MAVSAGPGVCCGSASDCSTTIVASRAAVAVEAVPRGMKLTDSMRTSRGPSAPGIATRVEEPVTRAFATSDTRPAHAIGRLAASYTVTPTRPACSGGSARATRSKRRFSAGSRAAARTTSRSADTRDATAASRAAAASNRPRSSASTRTSVSASVAPSRKRSTRRPDTPTASASRIPAPTTRHARVRIGGIQHTISSSLNLKLLLKRGALMTAANWQTVAIQFVAETTFQVLVAIPILGAAVLLSVVVGTDLSVLLQGGLRDIATRIAATLTAEPVALVSFGVAFSIALGGASVLMFLVKGGVLDVLLAAHEAAGAFETEPISIDTIEPAACFTLPRFIDGCTRLFRPYVRLGLTLFLA